MELDQKELLKALKLLKIGVDKGMAILNPEFIFADDSIVVYSSEVYIQYPFKTGFNFSVPVNEFYDIISNINDTKIEIKYLEKDNKITIKSKSVNASLAITHQEDIKKVIDRFGINNITRWKKTPLDFLDGVFLCSFSVSKDRKVSCLDCIYINDREIVSSDNYRISKYKLSKRMRESFLLLGSTALDLCKFNIKEFFVKDPHIYFKTSEGIIFITIMVNDKYPEIADIFKFESEKIELPKKLKDTIGLVSILAEGDYDIEKKIRVKIENKKILCRGERDIGWVENTLQIGFNGKANFYINPIFFGKILEKTNIMMIGEDKAIFKLDNFEHLISLL